MDRVARQAEIVGLFLGELGGVARETASEEEDRVPAEGLDLVELALGQWPRARGARSLRT